MKKILMLLASMGLTTTTTLSVVACGNNHRSTVVKIALKDLNLKKSLSTSTSDQEVAFDLFIKLNPEVSDLRANVIVSNFVAPKYNKTGSLAIQAKVDGKYQGTLSVTIPRLIQIPLSSLNQDALTGRENMTQDDAFTAFLNNQTQNLDDLRDNITLDFVKPDYKRGGWLIITAKENTKYTDSIKITINAIQPIDLEELADKKEIVLDIDGTQAMIDDSSGNAALDEFLKINAEKYPDLSSYVVVEVDSQVDYKNEKEGNGDGLISITGTGKYVGTISVVVKAVVVTDKLIFDVLSNDHSFILGERKPANQTLTEFVNNTLLGGGNDEHKWIKAQLANFVTTYPIINFIDYNKFAFNTFYLADQKTLLTDAWLSDNARIGVSVTIQAKMSYGQYTFFRSFYLITTDPV